MLGGHHRPSAARGEPGRVRRAAVRSSGDVVAASTSTNRTAASLSSVAVASLHRELALTPKPGLVCLDSVGSHADMTAATMGRSLFALRHGFAALAAAGARGAAFADLLAAALFVDAVTAAPRA